ncbi:MAG TPA: hypothetical protein DEF42_13110 [Desulfosporosinus sp.]|nr:hypothetical protein [Desulfosporosinus sp.]
MYFKYKLARDGSRSYAYPFEFNDIQNIMYSTTHVYFSSDSLFTGAELITEEEYSLAHYVPDDPQPHAPHEIDILGQELVEKELQILELQLENQVLGQQLVDIDLRLLMGGL